jgi:uncharacterized membrane protein
MIFSIIAIILVIASILLVTFNVLKGKWYAWLIYFSALFTAYSTTMIGLSVVGTDISRELLMSRLAIDNGWNLSLYDSSNTSVVVGWLIPQLSKLTNIDPLWIYKAFLPMIFAFTPVILYFIFRKMVGDLKAFYASMFFIIVPVFALEICTIGKSMVAEPLMALTFWVMFTNWKQAWKFFAMLGLTLLTLWAHYTVGLLLIAFLIAILLVMLVVKLIPKWDLFQEKSVSLWSIFAIILISSGAFVLYYANVGGGLLTTVVGGVGGYYVNSTSDAIVQSVTQNVTANITTSKQIADLTEHTFSDNPLLQSSVGLDFFNVGWSGKAFRIIQYLTQFLVVVGAVWLLFKSNVAKNGVRLYRFRAEFVACVGGALIMLIFCISVPYFASLINPTRYYHIALFFLAPVFVVAFDAVRNWKTKC